MTLRDLANHLASLDLDAAGAQALAAQAETLAHAVREAISRTTGGGHEYPWLRTGSLRESIQTDAGDSQAVVGSTSDVALYQELGTITVPPRPFLGPTAAAHADDIAASVGRFVVQAITT